MRFLADHHAEPRLAILRDDLVEVDVADVLSRRGDLDGEPEVAPRPHLACYVTQPCLLGRARDGVPHVEMLRHLAVVDPAMLALDVIERERTKRDETAMKHRSLRRRGGAASIAGMRWSQAARRIVSRSRARSSAATTRA